MKNFFLRHPSQTDVPVHDWIVLGRDPECGFRLSGDGVDERHARLESRDGLWIIRDLRSAGGTWVNDLRVAEAYLRPGDVLRLGEHEVPFLALEAGEKGFPLKSRNFKWNETLAAMEGVARSEHPVLLLGPSGTGKDVLAQALHERSRRKGALINVNCSALTETLIESELFGHIKGAFTGAINDRKGAFEAARGGTLFLDEIGDLPLGLQAKLLRALENSEIRPVGADRVIRTDVRIVAATHQNLIERIREGGFRADLFYRLNVITVDLPALAQRLEDFEDLLYGFARTHRVRFSVEAIHRLRAYSWPGNIRELKNLVARASALFPGESIDFERAQKLLIGRTTAAETVSPEEEERLAMPVIKEIEKQMILKRLRANRGNQRRTALDLGLPKSTLHDRIRHYGIVPAEFKLPVLRQEEVKA